jgi:hypothetical protein
VHTQYFVVTSEISYCINATIFMHQFHTVAQKHYEEVLSAKLIQKQVDVVRTLYVLEDAYDIIRLI